MNSLTDLREVVDVVIGVDTHVHTHSAAAIDAATGGVLDEITVLATAEGYAELVEFANNHAMLRAWAIEGTGGHGAGLSRHVLEMTEIVIELDRPKRAARRNGASPTRSMRSVPPVKQWPAHGWGVPAPGANAKRCQCFWPLAAPRSMPPPRPSSRSSAWLSQHPNPSEPGSAAKSSPPRSTPPRTCACVRRGTWRRPAPSSRCGPWPDARTRC